MASSSEKEEYFIRKFDGSNFTMWKERMKDVLINKGLSEPLKERAEGDGYTQAQWELLDAKAMATIRLYLAELVFVTSPTHIESATGRAHHIHSVSALQSEACKAKGRNEKLSLNLQNLMKSS